MPAEKIEWFNVSRGHGTIEREEGDDVFARSSAIQMEGFKALQEGDEVESEIIDDGKGSRAASVVVARAAERSPRLWIHSTGPPDGGPVPSLPRRSASTPESGYPVPTQLTGKSGGSLIISKSVAMSCFLSPARSGLRYSQAISPPGVTSNALP